MSAARRTLGRRSALTLVWGVVAFFAGQFVLGIAVEHWLPVARDPEYTAKVERLRARLAESPGRPLVLVLGSSRAEMGLCPGALGTGPDGKRPLVFNFGLTGGGSFLQAVSLRRLLAEGVRPDLLVIEVLPPTLNQPGGHPLEEEWFDAARLRCSETTFLRHYHSDAKRPLRQWLKGRVPSVWHREKLRRALPLDPPSWAATDRICDTLDDYGWLCHSEDEVTPEKQRFTSDGAFRQYGAAWGEFRLAEGPSRALADMLTWCRQRGIPVALLLMPEGPSFRAHYAPSMRAGIDAHLRALQQRCGVPLIDAREWLPEEDFWDSHHLLPRGAVAFTARFEHEALAPLLRRFVYK
ncbi:MAG TPA: hypothetical protein VKA46_03545 [Gemmataceae bacterium]|nr:hypothetical protein [Gemmataceae bacterium]